jgi:hypothetical protein
LAIRVLIIDRNIFYLNKEPKMKMFGRTTATLILILLWSTSALAQEGDPVDAQVENTEEVIEVDGEEGFILGGSVAYGVPQEFHVIAPQLNVGLDIRIGRHDLQFLIRGGPAVIIDRDYSTCKEWQDDYEYVYSCASTGYTVHGVVGGVFHFGEFFLGTHIGFGGGIRAQDSEFRNESIPFLINEFSLGYSNNGLLIGPLFRNTFYTMGMLPSFSLGLKVEYTFGS